MAVRGGAPFWQFGSVLTALVGLVLMWRVGGEAYDQAQILAGNSVSQLKAQLLFSAEDLRDYFLVRTSWESTLAYARSQMIDFGLIASILAVAALSGSLVVRLPDAGPRIRWLGRAAIGFGVGEAVFDSIENLMTISMLQSPMEIGSLQALTYSGVALLKLVCFCAAALAVALAIGVFVLALWVPRATAQDNH